MKDFITGSTREERDQKEVEKKSSNRLAELRAKNRENLLIKHNKLTGETSIVASLKGTRRKIFPALVARVINDFTLTINRGATHGISEGDKFLVYALDPEELIDPETKESLGHLELIRGTGIATHVQEKVTTIESNRYMSGGRIIRRQSGTLSILGGETIEESGKEKIPFEEPKIGNMVKPI